MRVYPKVSGLAAWSENCKWYSPLPLGAVVSLIRESSLVNFAAITLGVVSQLMFIDVYFVIDSVRKLLDTPSYTTGKMILSYCSRFLQENSGTGPKTMARQLSSSSLQIHLMSAILNQIIRSYINSEINVLS
jgi:hypothetical protein